MAAPLEEFSKWVKQGMDMAIENDHMRSFESWISQLNLSNIHIEHRLWQDDYVIRNTKNGKCYTIGRYQLLDAADPQYVFIVGVAKVLDKSIKEVGQMIQASQIDARDVGTVTAGPNSGITSAIYAPYAPGSHPIWIDSSGAGGAVGAPYTGMNYTAVGTIMHDMPELEAELEQKEEQLQRDLVRNRLFSEDERYQLKKVKDKILHLFTQNRLAEEMAIPFKFNKIVIAGGCFASLINDEPINDIDVFLLDDDYNRDLAQGVAKSYESEQPVVVLPQTFNANTANGKGLSGHISLSPKKHHNNHVRIGNTNYMENDKIERTIFFKHSRMQYITTKYKTREELINHFDFKHCCVSYDFATDKLYITREVYDLIKAKTLVKNDKSGRSPASWRWDKFTERGWKYEDTGPMFI